jgi:hyaluronoglucosaminidase
VPGLALALLLVTTVTCSADDGGADDGTAMPQPTAPRGSTTTATTRAPGAPLPEVVPTPRQMTWLGPDVTVPRRVRLVASDAVDEPTRTLLTDVLRSAGARTIESGPAGGGGPGGDEPETGGSGGGEPLVVRAGRVGDAAIAEALRAAGVDPPGELPGEGYALVAAPGSVVLAGADTTGTFYAAQTLRQLVGDGTVAGVSVVDHPAMPRRGVVEGFYGSPWTEAERLDQLAFYGQTKLNTYVYAPKDDPYHRERWREPYPADALAGLRRLIDTARAHHVRFTFAVSPGVSICYSDPADVAALEAKLAALHAEGVLDFAIALDDIDHERWHCDGDQARYGPPSAGAAGQAHADLLNNLQRGFVARHPGTRPLVLVPTEYQGLDDSPYRQATRERLDPVVEVMWTGRHVVPAEVTSAEATQAAERFGRRLLLWDNYPVNDYPRTAGRLLLAPYARRSTDLDQHLTGVIANPMNQAAASKVALVGVADFTWHTPAYDPARAHRAAARHLARGGAGPAATADPAVVEALLAFFDVQNLVPTSARSPDLLGQPQAPALAARLDTFRSRWSSGDRAGAVAELQPYAELLAAAPERIRSGVGDAAFVADCQPWLDATAFWGRALVHTLGALEARVAGDTAGADAHLARSAALVDQARAVHTVPGETRPQGPVLVADGVLDTFLSEARSLA